jgi:nicotinamide-nucleotide amidase
VKVETLAVGTELLLGDLVNGNAAWLGRRLAEAGLEVTRGAVVGDDVEEIADAVREALVRADAVVLTGGLGPTQDDLTRDALARLAGVPLRRDEGLAQALLDRYTALGRRFPERNLVQADVPEGATALPNPEGSAPGLRVEVGAGVAYALPGVPHEMETMFIASVLPDLLGRAGEPAAIVTRTLRTAGMWESAVAEALAPLHRTLAEAGNPTLAFLASAGETRVRLTARAVTADAARAVIAPYEQQAREALGRAVYGVDDDTLDVVVHRLLAARGATVAVAESLTGGMLGATLTDMPGASATFRGGLVVYATDLKGTLAAVPGPLLEAEGPVSAEVAAAMAAGVRDRLGATYGLALTGVAGPEPQDDQPVGTLHIGLAGPEVGEVRSVRVPGDRPRIRRYAVVAALDLLRRHLEAAG